MIHPAVVISHPTVSIYSSSRIPSSRAWASLNISPKHRGQ